MRGRFGGCSSARSPNMKRASFRSRSEDSIINDVKRSGDTVPGHGVISAIRAVLPRTCICCAVSRRVRSRPVVACHASIRYSSAYGYARPYADDQSIAARLQLERHGQCPVASGVRYDIAVEDLAT